MPSKALKMYKKKKLVADKYFEGICFICRKKYGRGFTFHHLTYVLGERIYRDFPDTIKYNLYILPIVSKNPERFMLLCKKHHTSVTRLKQYSKSTLIRLLIAIWNTQ